jgi:hypothetical protein
MGEALHLIEIKLSVLPSISILLFQEDCHYKQLTLF